jgi:drug/metabolite transporter (DMT)-like permease
MSQQNKHSSRHLPVSAGLILSFICFLWGLNAVSIKFSNQGMPPLMSAALRSLLAGALVWTYARMKGKKVAFPPGQSRHALIIGFLFGMEFLFVYWGLAFTPASRSLILLYTHAIWVALGAHFFLKDDRLTPVKFFGLVLAFCGVAAVFSARSPELPPSYWIGDLMELSAAIFWAATTLYVKHISQKVTLDHYQTLFAQLIYALPLLALGSFLFEFPVDLNLSPLVLASLFYQSVVVAFASFLIWFWLIHRHTVSRLASFTFMTPLFGAILGGLILDEPVTFLVWIGVACVAGGIYMVNR